MIDKGGHTMKTGLILVDIQNDYFAGGRMELEGISEAGQKAAELLSVFRENNWRTFHIQHLAARKGATFFLPDTEGAEIHDCIKPLSDETVIQKFYPNSFRETALLEELKKNQIGQVVICGAMSHMCIDATTRAAFDLGFKCMVIQDACATRNLEFGGKTIAAEQVHGSFMAALGSAYAGVLTLEEFKSNQLNP
jgi:nicotinamidase-related amidase